MNKIVADTYIFNDAGSCPVSKSKSNLEGGLSLIESELEETREAVEKLGIPLPPDEIIEALTEIADGAADIIMTAIGLLYRAGFEQDEVEDILDAVGEANKSKFCVSEDDADESVELYEDDHRYSDVHWEKVGNRYAIIGTYYTEQGSVRKILKAAHWQAPEDRIRKHAGQNVIRLLVPRHMRNINE